VAPTFAASPAELLRLVDVLGEVQHALDGAEREQADANRLERSCRERERGWAALAGAAAVLVWLIPAALLLGLIGLAAFLWALRSGQFEDLDGAANRILLDDSKPAPERKRD